MAFLTAGNIAICPFVFAAGRDWRRRDRISRPTAMFPLVDFFRARLSPVFVKYFTVSAAALCLDLAVLYALWLLLGTAAGAGAISYLAGNVFHYAVSMRFVFAGRRRASLSEKPPVEYAAWFSCSASGLLLTSLILYVGADVAGLPLFLVKAAAIPASFLAVYFLKSRLLFPAKKTGEVK